MRLIILVMIALQAKLAYSICFFYPNALNEDQLKKYNLFEVKYSFPKDEELISITSNISNMDLGYRFKLSYECYEYLNEVLNILKNNFVDSQSLNWEHIREKTFFRAAESRYRFQTHSAVKYALELLQEDPQHSQFIKKDAFIKAKKMGFKSLTEFEGKLLENNMGYLRLPPCYSMEMNYPRKSHEIIKQLIASGAKNWIIDLRGNPGGSCWPMLLALSPFFNQEVIGYFGDKQQHQIHWFVKGNAVGVGDYPPVCAIKDMDPMKITNSKIAILIDQKTASAAEAVAVAFKGQKGVCFIGSHTYGVTTGVNVHPLSDGNMLAIPEGFFYDRNTNIYLRGIQPDIKLNDDAPNEEFISAAQRWFGLKN